jgi:hypothetical protein
LRRNTDRGARFIWAFGSSFRGRKQFFFEKKNQKTFDCCPLLPGLTGATGAARNEQKFFGSFFQKRTASFPLPYALPRNLTA